MKEASALLRRCTSTFLIIILLAASVATVSAQDATPSPAAQPNRAIAFYPEATGQGTFISVELKPGKSVTVGVILGNAGDVEQTIRTYAVPAMSGTNGGFLQTDSGTPPDKQTTWLDYPETEFTFQPTEGASIPLTITVPKDASPGEYVTSLAAEQKDPFEVSGTDMIKQRVRWSVPILITVPGDRKPAFELGDVTLENREGIMIADIGITNTGNVIVRPQGEVRLLDASGTTVGVAQVALDSIYSGTTTDFIVAWDKVNPSDTFTVQAELTNDEGSLTVSQDYPNLIPFSSDPNPTNTGPTLTITNAKFEPLTKDNPPTTLQLDATVTNTGEPIENARVSIVTYQDGVEVDRYPILQAVTINQGSTPIQARYALPGGFTKGTYTFEVTIELGDIGTQTVLVTQKLDYKVTVP
jgi:hypothetical protein